MMNAAVETVPSRTQKPLTGVAAASPLPVIDDRKAERLPLRLPLSFTILLPGELLRGTTSTLDVSGRGLHFLVPRMVTPQTICQIDLSLPGEEAPLSFLGRSAWCRQARGRHRRSFDLGVAVSSADTYRDGAFARYCRFIAGALLRRHLH